MEIKIKVPDDVLVLVKKTHDGKSEIMAVFWEHKFSLEVLEAFFQLVTRTEVPSYLGMMQLHKEHYVKMFFGSYGIIEFDAI